MKLCHSPFIATAVLEGKSHTHEARTFADALGWVAAYPLAIAVRCALPRRRPRLVATRAAV